MQFDQVLDRAREHFTIDRVYGEPIERDGVTVIPVATVALGGGGGGGHDEAGNEGGGGGYGGQARPAGVYEVRGGEVRWRPAIDANRAIVAAAAVLIAFLLTRRR